MPEKPLIVEDPKIWYKDGIWKKPNAYNKGTETIFYPTKFWTVVFTGGDWAWFDFSTGDKSGALTPTCLTVNEWLARKVAAEHPLTQKGYKVEVKPYYLITP